MTVAISYFVEDLVRLLRCGGALPNKRTNGGLLLSLLKDKYQVKRHVALCKDGFMRMISGGILSLRGNEMTVAISL